MVLFSSSGKIKKYSCTEGIIDEFCKIRYKYYVLRKQSMIKTLERDNGQMNVEGFSLVWWILVVIGVCIGWLIGYAIDRIRGRR